MVGGGGTPAFILLPIGQEAIPLLQEASSFWLRDQKITYHVPPAVAPFLESSFHSFMSFKGWDPVLVEKQTDWNF